MVVLGPDRFLMGSPETEPHRVSTETRHLRELPHKFAIASREVTVRQFARFLQAEGITFDFPHQYCPDPECAQISVTWYLASRYCNWLSAVGNSCTTMVLRAE